MISLKRYLDSAMKPLKEEPETKPDLLKVAIEGYSATFEAVGVHCREACPATGGTLREGLGNLRMSFSVSMNTGELEEALSRFRAHLNDWSRATARHYKEKANEVKELLLTMARSIESVSTRDMQCAGQINEVTTRLQAIASLEDLTEIRASIQRSACELRNSIERMTIEGNAALDVLREQVAAYQTKLDEAEALASRDAMTGLSSRLYVEGEIEKRIARANPFCVVLIDIDGFKRVNDEHGHLTGDILLKQFGAELRSACHAMDVIGRWGGDEFLLLFDCELKETQARTERLRKWICGSYKVQATRGEIKLEG